jgi:hypothetical protein
MKFTDEKLNDIFDRTDGKCHICHKKLVFKNYGLLNGRGAWEVEHSNPQAMGGTNKLNNLYPSCIFCNRSKGAGTTRAARAMNGKTKAPMSAKKKGKKRVENTLVGAVIGGVLASLAGKRKVPIGIALGALIGNAQDPEE